MNVKKTISLTLLSLGLSTSLFAQTHAVKVTITVSNPSNLDRSGAIVSLPWADLTSKYPDIGTANFKILDASKKEITYQLERQGLPAVQNLLIQVNVRPRSSSKLSIVAGKPASAIKKTYARYVPERYDDFAWENDKVAFRMYGKALELRKDNAFGLDVWVKRTSKMVINDWYRSGDYHADHGEGMDYYGVGFTLGAGDIAPYKNDSIFFSGNYDQWKVLDNGPLRSTFELSYKGWDVAGLNVKVTKAITLDAGSHMNKVAATYTYTGDEQLPVVIGIVKRQEPGTILLDEQQGIMGYWEPKHGADGTTGVGVIMLSPEAKMDIDKLHLLSHASARKNHPLVYYNGAAWDRANEITTAQQWFTYLANFKAKLAEPLIVRVQ